MLLSDTQLVRAAQGGDVTSLGIVFERHRPPLHALALRMLGYAPQAQDAVQDTFLIALRNIERLRKPEAVSGWLCTILRNICLERIRQSRGEILIDEVAGGHLEREPYEPSIDEVIERLALRDWVWTALSELPEPLRITAMLRYFGSYPSYEELSAILGVPLGTVRSRLSRVKVKLADALLKTAGLEHDEARDLAEARARFFAEAVDDINRKRSHEMFTNAFSKDLVMYFPGRSVSHGHTALVTELEGDMEDGIKLHLTNVLASKAITVMEGDFENPPDDPFHCPPATSMVFFHHNGAIRRMRRYFALRTEEGCHNRREEQEVQP